MKTDELASRPSPPPRSRTGRSSGWTWVWARSGRPRSPTGRSWSGPGARLGRLLADRGRHGRPVRLAASVRPPLAGTFTAAIDAPVTIGAQLTQLGALSTSGTGRLPVVAGSWLHVTGSFHVNNPTAATLGLGCRVYVNGVSLEPPVANEWIQAGYNQDVPIVAAGQVPAGSTDVSLACVGTTLQVQWVRVNVPRTSREPPPLACRRAHPAAAERGQDPPVAASRWTWARSPPARRCQTPGAGRARRAVPRGTERACTTLGLAPGLAHLVARNADLPTAPTARADHVYSGVLYDALDLPGLPADARRCATSRVAVVSSLFGLVRPGLRSSRPTGSPATPRCPASVRWRASGVRTSALPYVRPSAPGCSSTSGPRRTPRSGGPSPTSPGGWSPCGCSTSRAAGARWSVTSTRPRRAGWCVAFWKTEPTPGSGRALVATLERLGWTVEAGAPRRPPPWDDPRCHREDSLTTIRVLARPGRG